MKAECADDTFPRVFKGKACADINVGDLLPKKQKPEAGTEKPPKPCTETEDGEVSTLWCQLEDMFQLIGTPQGIKLVLFQIIVTPLCFEKYRVEYKS